MIPRLRSMLVAATLLLPVTTLLAACGPMEQTGEEGQMVEVASPEITAESSSAQDVVPFFERISAILYETYRAVNSPVFTEYFEMLVDRYAGSDGYGWGIYSENPTIHYRVTGLPEGLASMVEVQQARQESFQDFSEAQVALWNSAWGSRHVSVYNAMPALSVVPDGFTVSDSRALPYKRVTIFNLKWDQAPAFREALAARSALDREAGLGSAFIMTAWSGSVGTERQTVMLRISAENRAVDSGANREARQVARAGYMEEWIRLTEIMSASAWRIESHNQTRRAELSFLPGS